MSKAYLPNTTAMEIEMDTVIFTIWEVRLLMWSAVLCMLACFYLGGADERERTKRYGGPRP